MSKSFCSCPSDSSSTTTAPGGSPGLRLTLSGPPGRPAPPPLRGCCRDAPNPGPRLVHEVHEAHEVHVVQDVHGARNEHEGRAVVPGRRTVEEHRQPFVFFALSDLSPRFLFPNVPSFPAWAGEMKQKTSMQRNNQVQFARRQYHKKAWLLQRFQITSEQQLRASSFSTNL